MNRQPTVYLETTIPSFLAAMRASDAITCGRQTVTRLWWRQRRRNYALRVSEFVLEEAARGDLLAARRRLRLLTGIPLLEIDEEVLRLARGLVSTGAIPTRAATDAGHIAVAARHGIDYLITWNCTHLANTEIIRMVGRVVEKSGFRLPTICTPDELYGGKNHEA